MYMENSHQLARTDDPQASLLFEDHYHKILVRCDRMFALLLGVQWVAAVLAALVISPYTWNGLSRSIHPHVWSAVFMGGITICFPIALALARPGKALSRQAIAIAQMLTSALLIHLTGGRIETHFHVFGSLALLAFYRDWRVLLTGTCI